MRRNSGLDLVFLIDVARSMPPLASICPTSNLRAVHRSVAALVVLSRIGLQEALEEHSEVQRKSIISRTGN